MTTTIANPRNPRLQALRRLQRRRERDRLGRFVVEGEDLIEAAARAGRTAIEGYRTPDCEIGDASFVEVEPQALASACALGSGARAVAVYEQHYAPVAVGPLCLYLHELSDPGNVGTCLRSAHAFGASCVALSPRCADPHSPKAVRASMGAIFAVPLARVSSVQELPGRTIALAARQGAPLEQAIAAAGSGEEGVSVLVGAEREGLPQELIDACQSVAHIPIASESLNAAMAASVALYEIARHFTRVRAS
jgi:RNA methyltransferase, TrmH family